MICVLEFVEVDACINSCYCYFFTGNTCPGTNAFYDPNVLVDRALVIEDIQSMPLLPSNAEPTPGGYLYLFPNLTFTEAGSIFQWRFGARVNDARSSQYPELQVWRGGDGEKFTLVTTTNNNQDPSRVLAALNVYSYDVDLTYEAGDILALYQPPISTSKYLLSFVSSRNYESQNLAYEIQITNASLLDQGQLPLSLIDSSGTSTLVEPLLSILSTSMPNDTDISISFGPVPFDAPTPSSQPTTPETMLSSSGNPDPSTPSNIDGIALAGVIITIGLIAVLLGTTAIVLSTYAIRRVKTKRVNAAFSIPTDNITTTINESYAAITRQSMQMKNNPSYALSHTNAKSARVTVNPDTSTPSQDRYAVPADPVYDVVEEDEEHSYVIV